MAEGYITRIGRLISASANTLVDSLENVAPQMVMEQTIREIDDAMSDVRQQLGKVEAARYLSTKGLNNDNAKHAELQDQIDVAINAGRDDLAEAAIARQMDIEAMTYSFLIGVCNCAIRCRIRSARGVIFSALASCAVCDCKKLGNKRAIKFSLTGSKRCSSCDTN